MLRGNEQNVDNKGLQKNGSDDEVFKCVIIRAKMNRDVFGHNYKRMVYITCYPFHLLRIKFT